MGLLWDYFRDGLRLPFLAKPGPLAMLVDGGSESLDAARDVPAQLRDQFFADRCEAVRLESFARSRGIVRAVLEPELSYHGRVQLAFLWHKRGGRASAMEKVLEDYFGFASVQVESMRDEDPARWAEFRVVCNMVGAQPLFTTGQVEWAINEMKPARSKLNEVVYLSSIIGDVPVMSFGCYSMGDTSVFP
jgi:hypothetical protein